jgi:hypothetical protein
VAGAVHLQKGREESLRSFSRFFEDPQGRTFEILSTSGGVCIDPNPRGIFLLACGQKQFSCLSHNWLVFSCFSPSASRFGGVYVRRPRAP